MSCHRLPNEHGKKRRAQPSVSVPPLLAASKVSAGAESSPPAASPFSPLPAAVSVASPLFSRNGPAPSPAFPQPARAAHKLAPSAEAFPPYQKNLRSTNCSPARTSSDLPLPAAKAAPPPVPPPPITPARSLPEPQALQLQNR